MNLDKEDIKQILEKLEATYYYNPTKTAYWEENPKAKLVDKWFNLRRISKMYQLIDKTENLKILDVGCGKAFYHDPLLKKNKVYGLDPFAFYHDSLLKKNKAPGLNSSNNENNTEDYKGSVICADGSYIPFKDNTFDMVLCLEVIEHLGVEKTKTVLMEIKRVLKKGGIVIISTPNAKNVIKFFKSNLKLRSNLKGVPQVSLTEVSSSESLKKYVREGHIHEFKTSELKKLMSEYFNGTNITNCCIPYWAFQALPIKKDNLTHFIDAVQKFSDIIKLNSFFYFNFFAKATKI